VIVSSSPARLIDTIPPSPTQFPKQIKCILLEIWTIYTDSILASKVDTKRESCGSNQQADFFTDVRLISKPLAINFTDKSIVMSE
jgi:hypothetical protein